MSETVFAADPTRLLIAAAAGIVLLLLLIIKFKFHPVLSLLISALLIGLGAGMPVPTLVNTVEKGAGETLQGIVLLIGLGSLFGGILEVSGGAQCVAQTLVNRFGEKKAGIALGITGLVVGTTVFFEAGVVILIPLAFGLAKKTKKSTLYYVIPLLAGLATGFAFIPPSAGSVLVANMLGVDLGIMIAVGVPIGILSLIFAGILWSKFIGTKIHTGLPTTVSEVREEEEANLPKFSTVIAIILVPLVLILCSTLSEYIPALDGIRPVLEFVGTPFVALIIAVLCAMYFLGKKQGYDGEQLKKIMDRSLRPTGQILLVITGGGIIRWVLQDCGMGDIIGPALEKSGLPLILVAFLIAALVRASVGAAVVAMTMAAGIMASMPAVAGLSPLYLAAMVCAITGGATAFSHVNDSGFWLVSSLLEIDEKTTLKSWTMMETIIGFTGLPVTFIVNTNVDRNDIDHPLHLYHRIELTFSTGRLCLVNTHGPVIWLPFLHMPRDEYGTLSINVEEEVNIPSGVTIGNVMLPSVKETFEQIWPDAVKKALEILFKQNRTEKMSMAQYQIYVSKLWSEICQKVGYMNIVDYDNFGDIKSIFYDLEKRHLIKKENDGIE